MTNLQTLQRRQVIGLTFVGGLLLILAVATYLSGEYRELPTWRIVMDVLMGVAGIVLLWEIWKPGGAGRR